MSGTKPSYSGAAASLGKSSGFHSRTRIPRISFWFFRWSWTVAMRVDQPQRSATGANESAHRWRPHRNSRFSKRRGGAAIRWNVYYKSPLRMRRTKAAYSGRYLAPSRPGYSTEMKEESRAALVYPQGPAWRDALPNRHSSVSRGGFC